ncbi:MAG TPA: RnfH family protein [Rhodoferax sp.]|nr:RnfH family protein [Rhodoferax sp.]
MATEANLCITVVYATAPRVIREVEIQLTHGATVADAIRASGVLEGVCADEADALTVGIWGRKAGLTHVLRDRDRVELCRPLRVDPKVARRERFVRQGAKSAGLFAQRRQGAKAGY